MYEKGQQLIYLGDWSALEVEVVYFLFKIDDEFDPIHDYIVTRDKNRVKAYGNRWRNNDNLGADPSLIWVKNGRHLRGYSDRTYRRSQSACGFLQRWQHTVESLSPGPWVFIENEFLVHNPHFAVMRMKVVLKWLLSSCWYLLRVYAVGLLDILFHDLFSFFRKRAEFFRARTDFKAAKQRLETLKSASWFTPDEKRDAVSKAQVKVSERSDHLETLRKQSSESSRGFIVLVLSLATILALVVGLRSEARRRSELERRLRRVESFLSLDEMPEQGEPRSR